MRYRFDTGGEPLNEIAHEDICRGAAFRLDKPLHITVDDVFVLDEGQWYLMEGKERRALEGRWVSPRILAVPEKPQRHRVHPVLVNVEDADEKS